MGQRTRSAIKMFRIGLLVLPALFFSSPMQARSKPAATDASVVDSGTLSILIAGRKIGTETFTVKQLPEFSVASAEIRIDEGESKSHQTSELRLSPGGELQHYEWHEMAPGKSDVIVEPQDEFLMEHMTGDKGKKVDQPFMMPASTTVLDDFFFSQREILLWRYLASICKPVNGETQCAQQKSRFGVIIPHQHTSAIVDVEYLGRENVSLHGTPQELAHFRITSEETADWELFLDSHQKLVRILIPAMNTEVVRE